MNVMLDVNDLVMEIETPRGAVRPVNGASLTLSRGELVGIVGETGSGKSMLVRSIMGLLPPNAAVDAQSSIRFDGEELVGLPMARRREMWGSKIALIPQDPATSLNPVRKVGTQICDTLRRRGGLTRKEARARAAELLHEVGIADPVKRLGLYPHEMSGGMRQRVLIAIALANSPDLLIADEPTTALDVTIQRQILDLIDDLRHSHNVGVLLISHDLSVVAGRSDRVLVLYGGRLIEMLPSRSLVNGSRHPYTRGLLLSHPSIDAEPRVDLPTIPGEPPDISARSDEGCPFGPRCLNRLAICQSAMPDLLQVGQRPGEHLLACHNPIGVEVSDVNVDEGNMHEVSS